MRGGAGVVPAISPVARGRFRPRLDLVPQPYIRPVSSFCSIAYPDAEQWSTEFWNAYERLMASRAEEVVLVNQSNLGDKAEDTVPSTSW